jgi:hypothetical protein
MKTYYNPEGDACWIDQEVEIIAWDRDKWFTFKDSAGEIRTDKGWKFALKRSNKLWELPEGYLDETVPVSRKESAKQLKDRRKTSAVYRVKIESLGYYKEFKSLRKAMNFCKSNSDATFLHACFYYKNGSCSTPVLEKQDDNWYYFGSGQGRRNKNISYKTLSKFCMEN